MDLNSDQKKTTNGFGTLEFLPEIFKNSGPLQSATLSKFRPEKLTNTLKRSIVSAPTLF